MERCINPKDIDVSKFEEDGGTTMPIENPFELKLKDFLDFAGEDLKGQSIRDTVNALGNIKRSIDCLFDSLLFAVNFLEYSQRKRWTFPEKMTFLSEIGIITPYILGKINSARNLLEHEFKKPNRAEVETAFDVAVLLYYATARFTRWFHENSHLVSEDEKVGINIRIDRKKRRIDISSTTDSFSDLSVSWDKNPEEYKQWLHLVYQVQYLRL